MGREASRMERMGDILAKTARSRARRGRIGIAQTSATAQPPAPPATQQSTPPRPAARATRALRRTPVSRGAQPAHTAMPGYPADVTQRAIPPADALDTERILELAAPLAT